MFSNALVDGEHYNRNRERERVERKERQNTTGYGQQHKQMKGIRIQTIENNIYMKERESSM